MPTIELIKDKKYPENKNRKTTFTLSFIEIYTMTLRRDEFSRLGLTKNILFNMFLDYESLADQKLTIEELKKFDRPIQKKWKLKICKKLFVSICKEMERYDISKIVENRNVYSMDDGFLALNNLSENDFFDLAMSQFILSKIKLSVDDLRKIGIPENIVKLSEEPLITFTLQKSIDALDSRRSRRCLVRKRCEDFFYRVKDGCHDSFTCMKCFLFEAERRFERDGCFTDWQSFSYGIVDLDSSY